MNDLNIDVVFNIDFTKSQCKSFKIKDSNEMRGLYLYDYNQAIVNLGSVDFEEATTNKQIIKLFTEIVTHETLHHAIHGITGEYAVTDGTEERFIDLIMENMEC